MKPADPVTKTIIVQMIDETPSPARPVARMRLQLSSARGISYPACRRVASAIKLKPAGRSWESVVDMEQRSNRQLDIATNRKQRKWTRWELAGRVAWTFGAALFRLVPRPMWGVRNSLLRLFGAKVGANVRVHPTVNIFIPWNVTLGDDVGVGDGVHLYSLGPIKVEREATVSQRAHLCAGTHDFTDPAMPLLKPPITVKQGAWICTEAFVGPGVTVGEMAVVGARAVVVRDVPAMAIVAGNPATRRGVRQMRNAP